MTMDITDKLDFWKKRLLDLGKRNRLINCPLPTAGSRVQRHSLLISKPTPLEIWTFLNENDGVITFPIPVETTDEQIEDENLEDDVDIDSDDNSIKTNQSVKDTNKTLQSLLKKAKEFNEEKGLNVLYLAFGFLNWKENGTEGQELRSPLLLLPVKLQQIDLFSAIKLSCSDEEITTNYSLAQKLLGDFNIRLPQFSEDKGVQEYIQEVEQAVENMGWSVTTDVTQLSLFSFMKVNMYRDLEKNAAEICGHSIVRGINGEATQSDIDISDIENYNHDRTPPSEVFSVVDADASQQDAILLAKKGVSFVLQGPPGTGKSQTITNIIAELLADGKKVLFVSEKMAALDVVYKRLSQVGLSDFCLSLHSNNTKRREILDQLEKSIKLSRKKITIQQDAFNILSHLQETRDNLNQYNEQLHTAIEPLGKTIYQINGYLSALEDTRNIDYVQTDAENFTPILFAQCESALSELSRIVEKSGYQENNPWKGCILESPPTHEFRQRFTVDADKAISYLRKGLSLLSQLNGLTGSVDYEWSYPNIKQLNSIHSLFLSNPGVNTSWLSLVFPHTLTCFENYSDSVSKKNELLSEKQKLNANIASNNEQLQDCEINCNKEQSLLNEIKDKYETEQKALFTRCDESILAAEISSIIERFRSDYRSITRFFKTSYHNDRKFLLRHCKKAEKLTYEDALNLLGEIEIVLSLYTALANQISVAESSASRFENTKLESSELQSSLNELESAISSNEKNIEKSKYELEHALQSVSELSSIEVAEDMDFESFRNKLEWCNEFSDKINKFSFGQSFASSVCENDLSAISQFKSIADSINQWADEAKPVVDTFINLFDEDRRNYLSAVSFKQLLAIITACRNSFADLEHLIDYRIASERLKVLNLDTYLEEARKNNLNSVEVTDAFRKCFYRSWLDAVVPRFPVIHNFRRLRQDDTVKSFMKLDKQQLDISKLVLTSRLISHLPNFDAFSTSGEMALLRREFAKKRKLMPIRLLIAALPNLLPSLKPCMMMSPLSVSTYLGSSNYEFDTVIFDEASQVRTEDAIGAIFRAKQVIIAGDSKQLPPTDFFNSSMSADDNFDEDESGVINDAGAYESLLDEAAMLPARTLLWHYRSRDEHLIAFSNAKIYKGNLITFPSAIEKASGMGVEYVYVAGGTYDRGGKNGNAAEAEQVAEMVFDHFRKFPNRSLGIIAFGEVQQSAIEDALLIKRRQNHSFEPFFKDDKDEALFIKNLETVQGDERDTIIFSIGYAPDKTGKFVMNFGPLSRDGGERRLNVAVTRARYNLKLVGSIMPTYIKVESISGQGPKLLRQYIDFAIYGEKAILGEISENEDLWFDSPFETSVYNFLVSNGYDVATQVGCSGYRIDLAVRHPNYNGRFAIGIECDGAMYHSARTARERDRLRQTVLEDMGWKIYRIWSTDWIKDRHTEGERLLKAVRQSIENYHEEVPEQIEEKSDISDLVVVETQSEFDRKYDGIQEKSDLLRSRFYGYTSKEIPVKDFEEVMLKVIQNTIGLNQAEVFKETAYFGYGWERMGAVIKKKFETTFNRLLRDGKIEIDSDGKIDVKE